MAVLLVPRDGQILSEILSEMTTGTGLTRSSPGSKLRTLSESVSNKLGRMYTKLDVNIVQAFLSGATGQYLDFIGELLGKTRYDRQVALVTARSFNVRFFVDSGTFGAINGGASILLKRNTIVSSGRNSTGTIYKVLYDTLLNSSLSEVYVAVQASTIGAAGNIGANQLVYHNFTDYTDSLNQTLKVSNRAEIVTGSDVESDTNYRYRLSQAVTESEQANKTAIRLAALSVPGVADVIMEPYARGLSTFDLLVKSIAPRCTDGLLTAVQFAVDGATAQGASPIAKRPIEVGLTFKVDIQLREVIPIQDALNIITNGKQTLTNYVNNTDIGESIIVNKFTQIVMGLDGRIKTVGTPTKPITWMYTHKQTRLLDNYVRETLIDPSSGLIGDYSTKANERVIIFDGSVGDPIQVAIEGYDV
jgi:uncharacterized phage protein gp47/JayE